MNIQTLIRITNTFNTFLLNGISGSMKSTPPPSPFSIQFSNEMAALNVLLFIYIIFILLLHLTLNLMLWMIPDNNFEWKYSILLSSQCTVCCVCIKCIDMALHDCALFTRTLRVDCISNRFPIACLA